MTAEREAEAPIFRVIAARPDLDVSRSEQVAAARDAARVDRVLDGLGPAPDVLERRTRLPVRSRAQRAALDDRESYSGRRDRQWARGRRPFAGTTVQQQPCRARRGSTLMMRNTELVVASHSDARVWSDLRLVSLWWSVRIQVPRMVVALYEVRNNRGVGHVGGDVDPNHMDAVLVLEMAKWLMAELVRIFHDVDVTTATEVVDALVERTVPIIWDVGDQRRVLDPSLTQRDRTLLLLYASTGSVMEADLIRWVEARHPSSYRRDILRKLHLERLVEYDESTKTVRISPIGSDEVETNLRSASSDVKGWSGEAGQRHDAVPELRRDPYTRDPCRRGATPPRRRTRPLPTLRHAHDHGRRIRRRHVPGPGRGGGACLSPRPRHRGRPATPHP